MKLAILAVLATLALASCGGTGNREALVDACMEGGESEANCTCLANAADEELDAKLYGKLVEVTKVGDEKAAEIMSGLTTEQQGQLFSFAMAAAVSCGAGLGVPE